MKVPYVEDKSASGGFGSPSEEDLSRMVRATVESWQPKRGPDWSNILVRIASAGPPAWANSTPLPVTKNVRLSIRIDPLMLLIYFAQDQGSHAHR